MEKGIGSTEGLKFRGRLGESSFIEAVLLVIDLEGSIDFFQMVGIAWNMQIVVVTKIRSLLYLTKVWDFEK